MFQRALAAALPALLLVLLAVTPAAATQQDRKQDQSEERDGPSRNESGRLSYVPVRTADGEWRIRRIVLIQTRFIHVVDTSFAPGGFGVDFKNLDKVDLGEVPLIGSVFNRSLSADDLGDDSRVGAVYDAGEETLAAVLDDRINVGGLKVSVVNGKGQFELIVEPRIIEVQPTELGDFGQLGVVQQLVTQKTGPEATIVLGGLTASSVPETESKLPWLGDIPGLQNLFRGTVHEKDESELLLFIKPSILIDSES